VLRRREERANLLPELLRETETRPWWGAPEQHPTEGDDTSSTRTS